MFALNPEFFEIISKNFLENGIVDLLFQIFKLKSWIFKSAYKHFLFQVNFL